MRLTRLHLRNYRVYESPLDLELPAGLVGIYGPNGSGKSVLMESVLWALWGRARTAKEGVRTSGTNAPCVAEVEFEHESHLYVVRRTISGVANHVDAEAHADGRQVAAGASDTRRYVHSVLGMGDAAFRASVFAEQKQLAAFSESSPAERRRLVLQLLGITPLDGARDQARADASSAEKQHERLRTMLPDMAGLEAEAEIAEREAAATDGARARAEAEALERRRAFEAAQAHADALASLEREHDALVAEGRTVRVELERAQEQVADLERQLAQLTAAAAELERLRPQAQGLAPAERRLSLLEAWAAARAHRSALVVPDEPPQPDDAGCESARQAVERARAELAGLDGRRRGAAEDLARAELAVARSAELDPDAECPMCGQALGDAVDAVQSHRAVELAEARARLAEIEAGRAGLVAEVERLAAESTRQTQGLTAARSARAEWEKARDRAAQADEALERATSALDQPPADGELELLAREVASARTAARRCDQLEGALARRGAVEADLETQRGRVEHAVAARQNLLDKLDALGFRPTDLAEARARLADARSSSEASSTLAQEAVVAATQAAERRRASAKQMAEAQEQHRRLDELAQEARHVRRAADLLAAFRNTVVGRVGPRLSQQAAELFAELTDHEYDELRVDRDTYDINVVDGGVSYKMDRFSGSETDLANLALRVAISEHVRFQSGGAVGLLVLDEVFGPLDEERKERMLLALERLRGRFRQVLVVTHDAEVKEQLPGAIQVTKLPGRRATASVVA